MWSQGYEERQDDINWRGLKYLKTLHMNINWNNPINFHCPKLKTKFILYMLIVEIILFWWWESCMSYSTFLQNHQREQLLTSVEYQRVHGSFTNQCLCFCSEPSSFSVTESVRTVTEGVGLHWGDAVFINVILRGSQKLSSIWFGEYISSFKPGLGQSWGHGSGSLQLNRIYFILFFKKNTELDWRLNQVVMYNTTQYLQTLWYISLAYILTSTKC